MQLDDVPVMDIAASNALHVGGWNLVKNVQGDALLVINNRVFE